MAKSLFVLLVIASFSPVAVGDDFVRDGWPGGGTPRLAARTDQLVLHDTSDTASESRQLKYKAGWLIVWDQSKVITKKSAIWNVKKEIDEGSCGTLFPGDRVEFLQFETDGWGTFRVQDKICSLKASRGSDFDKVDERPRVEWWVRVLDNSKSPIGWLLVEARQVDLLPR